MAHDSEPGYRIEDKGAYLARMRDMLDVRMAADTHRRNHTLGVARTAARLAEVYGVDPFLAEAAGR